MWEAIIKVIAFVNLLDVILAQRNSKSSNISLEMIQLPAIDNGKYIWRLVSNVCECNAGNVRTLYISDFSRTFDTFLLSSLTAFDLRPGLFISHSLKSCLSLEAALTECTIW